MVVVNKNYEKRRIVKQIAGKEVITDEDGFVQNLSMWSEEVARVLAKEVGIDTLSDEQWRVLKFIRAYYLEQGKDPMNHKIKQGTGMDVKKIQHLFPGGISRAKRLAGLPRPKGCGG